MSKFSISKGARRGALRVSAYLLALSLGGAFLGVRHVQAAMGERLFALGREAARLGVVDDSSNRLRINGEELSLSLITVEASVAQVLDQVQSLCDQKASTFRELWQELPKQLSAERRAALSASGLRFGSSAFRFEKPDAGVVLCFVDPSEAERNGLLERLQAAVDSGDLGRLGALRYVSAQRTGTRTQLTVLDSEHSLNLERLVGDTNGGSDVAGRDPVQVQRPPRSRRAFSAAALNTPYNYNVYESPESVEAVLARYDREMKASGWEVVPAPQLEDPWQRAFIKPMRMVVVVAAPSGDGSAVSLLEASVPVAEPKARSEEL
ncbi:MAG: hypothetical protein QM756_15915 [Polyangiaceae bacterium]